LDQNSVFALRVNRVRHEYENTCGVPETGSAGTGTVCKTPTRGYTATRTAVSRVCTGIRSKNIIIILFTYFTFLWGEKWRLCERLYMFLVCTQTTCYCLVWPTTMALLPSHCHHHSHCHHSHTLSHSRFTALAVSLHCSHCLTFIVTALALALSFLLSLLSPSPLSLSPTCCATTGENSCHVTNCQHLTRKLVTSQLTGSQH